MRKIVLVVCAAAVLGLLPADAVASCFDQAAACFQRAAARDSFMGRTLAALDCELDLIECARRKIIGR